MVQCTGRFNYSISERHFCFNIFSLITKLAFQLTESECTSNTRVSCQTPRRINDETLLSAVNIDTLVGVEERGRRWGRGGGGELEQFPIAGAGGGTRDAVRVVKVDVELRAVRACVCM